MTGPEDVIIRHGKPISPFVSQGIGLLFFGIGAWACWRVLFKAVDLKGWEQAVLCGLLAGFFGAVGFGAIAIADKQANLIVSMEQE
ncbi:MAG: hypothetical protein AAGK17_07180 [Pseudomonadota bacterium]